MKKRTICVIPCEILVVFDDWGKRAYAEKPFQEFPPLSNFKLLHPKDLSPEKHVIHLALNWREALNNGAYESCPAIAKEIGISDSKVKQTIWLLKLCDEIIEDLQRVKCSKLSKCLGLKNLIALRNLTQVEQIESYRRLKNSVQFASFESNHSAD